MPLILGAVAALYVSRVVVEFSPASWPLAGVWIVAILLALLTLAVSVAIDAFGCETAPFAALALYLISPRIDPTLAAITGAVAALGVFLLAVGNPIARASIDRVGAILRRPGQVSDAGLLVVSLALYTRTLAPGLLPADSGEFQVVAPTLGVAHPPGYALYTLVGKAFTLIPVGTPAYRLNLLSVVLAAVTLLVVSRAVRRLTGSTIAGLIAAMVLAGAPTFWAQATTANIRMPTALFTALILWLLLRFGETGEGHYLVLTAFTFGLGITHHVSLAFLAPPAAVYAAWVRPDVWRDARLIGESAAAFAVALLVWLYFPIRGAADAPLAPGGLTTLEGFLYHVLARGFRGDILAFTAQQMVADRLRVLFNILTIQFGWPLLLITVIGLSAVVVSRRSPNPLAAFPRRGLGGRNGVATLAFLSASFAVIAGVAITYRAPQTVEYLMPAYVVLGLLIGVGVVGLARLLAQPSVEAVVLALALVLGAGRIWLAAPSFLKLSVVSDTRATVEPVLEAAPSDAVVLSNWHWATAFWYLQLVEGMRLDVTVDYVAPAGAEPYPETWRRRIAAALEDGQPVIVTNRYATYAELQARLTPFGGAYRVMRDASGIPETATRARVQFALQQARDSGDVDADVIALRAFDVSDSRLEPGESLTVRLWWEPLVDAQRDYSVFVHLIDGGGQPIGQADVVYSAGRLTAGTLVEDAYSLAVLPTTPPGDYALIAGFYFTQDGGGFERLISDGRDSADLEAVVVEPRRTAPVTLHPLYVPFAGGPTLVGVDYDASWPDVVRAYLHWQSTDGVPSTMLGPGPSAMGGAGPWVASVVQGSDTVGQTTVPSAPPVDTTAMFVTTSVDFPDGGNLGLEVAPVDAGPLSALGAWQLSLLGQSRLLPAVGSDERFLVFGRAMALIGADWHVAGNEVIVDLEWLALMPVTDDYTVSVQLAGESGWRAQHDGTPALGAIPTLKWIQGVRVIDRHRVALPDAGDGRAAIQISVYDAFTQRPLGVLDDRFQRIGQGEAAVVGQLVLP